MGSERQNKKLVIIGSGVAARSALQSIRHQRNYEVAVVRKHPDQVVPCAIPYTFQRLMPENIKIPDENWASINATVIDDIVTEIDRDKQKIYLQNNSGLDYDKLLITTGTSPVKPPIPGIDLENVYFVEKDLKLLSEVHSQIMNSRKVAILGGGFIGVELADEISNLEHLNSVNLIEAEERLLPKAFDVEFSKEAEKELRGRVNIHTGVKVEEITGNNGAVSNIVLSDGQQITADLVICAIGVTPNNYLAREAGLTLGGDGGVRVDDYFYTSDFSIMACGDCTTKRDQVSGGISGVRLASTAAREGMVAGLNLNGRIIPNNKGVINNFSTKIGNTVLGSAGIQEEEADLNLYSTITVKDVFPNRHPPKFPDAGETFVKLIFNKVDGVLMGGQVKGDQGVAELVNLIGLAVQHKLTASQLATSQYATHPLLTPGPSKYPVLRLALDACRSLGG